MNDLDSRLQLLQAKIDQGSPITIMIMGLGSVGNYLLDYLVSNVDPQMHIVVAGRNEAKLQQDVNIVKTAATIRHQMRCRISVDGNCDLNDVNAITEALRRWSPDFLVNTSRVYAGLKYGSISWHNLRAYGIWTPLSIRYARNIMMACEQADCHAITINTSYSDAVIPWLKSAGLRYFDFGSGNLNHLIPRIKFYVADKYGVDNLNDIDVTLAVSHFHDVVISKEGHTEGQNILLDIAGFDCVTDDLFKACSISMPVDQKRNMMNASSNYEIIMGILKALREKCKVKVHSPGVCGEIGGYPIMIDGRGKAKAYFDETVFSMDQMRRANRASIYLDGIEDVRDGCLHYTPELVAKVKEKFGVDLPKVVAFDEIDCVGQFLIENIIKPQTNC